MGMKVDAVYSGIQSTVTEQQAHELRKAAIRDDEADGGCCSGPGTAGTDRLKDLFVKNEGKKFQDLNVRAYLSHELGLTSQGVSKDSVAEKK
jgi:hypothetical protein